MKTRIPFLLLTPALLMCGGLVSRGATNTDSPAPEAASATALARIGDTEVTTDDIRASLESLDSASLAAMSRDPALLSQVVRTLLVQRLVLKEALAKHWDTDPAVAAQVERARQAAIAESYLQAMCKPPENYPSDAELQAAYDNNKAELLVPRQWRLGQIFVALPQGADDATTAKAQARLEVVRKSLHARDADFATLASAWSDEMRTASHGGEIGWLTESRIQPEIRPSVLSLQKGAISEPLRLNDGWHILKCLDTKDAYTPALADIRPQLVQQLRANRAKANRQAYLAKLLQQNPVAINELALSKVLDK